MVKILHTSDLQLDAPFEFLGEKGAVHRQQLRNTFKKIVELARTGQYDMLLIAGDLFNDNRPSRATVSFVKETLAALSIPVCILPGNHDCYDKSSIYRKEAFSSNVHILSDTPTLLDFPDLDLTVAGNAHLSQHTPVSRLRDITRQSNRRWFIVLAHGNMQIPGLIANEERPILPSEIAACGADYVALGDWHTFANYSQGRVKAFYSGAPEPARLDQTGSGHVASVVLSEKGTQVQPVRVGTIETDRLLVDVTGLSEQDALTAIKAKAKPTLMLDVVICGIASFGELFDAEQFQQAAADEFYWLQVANQTHVEIANIDPADFPETQVIGQYVKMLSERIKTTIGEREKRIAEQALQLGIALLRGEAVLR